MERGNGRPKKRDRKMNVPDNTIAANRVPAHMHTAWQQHSCSLQSSHTQAHSMAAKNAQSRGCFSLLTNCELRESVGSVYFILSHESKFRQQYLLNSGF